MNNSSQRTKVAVEICAQNQLSLVGKVGQGAYKETFHTRASDGTSSALKIFGENCRIERVERELKAMHRCNHPKIAKLYELGTFEFEGGLFIYTIEEFLGGGTLTEKVNQNGYLDISSSLLLGEQLIDAIEYIESLGLVHRDLKPDNILFREGINEAIITDFGIVRDLNATSLTETWIPTGLCTPFFAAPEQLNNDKDLIDWRTDQFSLGVLLTVCAFGQHPYGSNSPENVVAQRGNLSQSFRNEVQNSGLVALERMVALWPAQRFRSPQELKAAWGMQKVK